MSEEPEPKVRSRRRKRKSYSILLPKTIMIVCGLLVLGGLGVLGYLVIHAPRTTDNDALLGAQALVRQRLPPGTRVLFSGIAESHVEATPDGKYYVRGWVDATSPSGQTGRYRFSCHLYRDDAGAWVTSDLELVPVFAAVRRDVRV